MQLLQNHVNDLTNQQGALTQLQSTFQSLDAALQGIGMASGGSVSASVSDSSAVRAATTSAALPGTYSIQVDGLGLLHHRDEPGRPHAGNRSQHAEHQLRIVFHAHGKWQGHHHYAGVQLA